MSDGSDGSDGSDEGGICCSRVLWRSRQVATLREMKPPLMLGIGGGVRVVALAKIIRQQELQQRELLQQELQQRERQLFCVSGELS